MKTFCVFPRLLLWQLLNLLKMCLEIQLKMDEGGAEKGDVVLKPTSKTLLSAGKQAV